MRRSRELLFNAATQKLELLLTPLNKLEVALEKSDHAEAVRVALADLKRARITKLQPYFYLSTGYGTVAGTSSIALGFYDCNDLLRELNRELRGFEYNFEERVDLVRHEMGHAFAYVYKLYRRDDFRAMFNVQGNYYLTYPESDSYLDRVNPWSLDYVNPSGDHYAQKHPDEDFAETFTVWLRPRSNWRKTYRRYPGALRKLEFVDALIKELRSQTPLVEQTPYPYEPLSAFHETVAHFFHLPNTQAYRHQATGYVDPDLKKLFLRPPAFRGQRKRERDYLRADSFLRKNKRRIVAQVNRWVGGDEVVVKDFLDKCGLRAHALDLWLRKDEPDKKLLEFTSYVSYHCALYAVNENYFAQKGKSPKSKSQKSEVLGPKSNPLPTVY